MADTKHTASGMGFCGWLTLLFIALKLTGYIDWSWWWVTSPLWAPLVVVLAVGLPILFVVWCFTER